VCTACDLPRCTVKRNPHPDTPLFCRDHPSQMLAYDSTATQAVCLRILRIVKLSCMLKGLVKSRFFSTG
jgi:hypothetical protein